MPALPKARCPRCGREVPLRVGGELREHRTSMTGEKCAASGKTLAEARLMPQLGEDSERGELIFDPNRPMWPLLLFPILILGLPWLVEVVGGWL